VVTSPIRQHHLLMFDCGMLSERYAAITAPNGVSLPAVYIDANTGERVREVHLNFSGKVELHFTASKKDMLAGLWYLQQYDPSGKNWRCSCLECKQGGWCPHLERFAPAVVA
jgi:hypothetical protein